MIKHTGIIILLLCIISVLAGCSTYNDSTKNESTAAQTEQAQQITEQPTAAVSEVTTEEVIEFSTEIENGDPVISEEDAKKVAYKALENECNNKTFADDINDFTFESIKRCDIREIYCAFNTGYDNSAYNTSGHPYYAVSYTDNTEISGFAYFCIDLRNGDLLFSGYMGD